MPERFEYHQSGDGYDVVQRLSPPKGWTDVPGGDVRRIDRLDPAGRNRRIKATIQGSLLDPFAGTGTHRDPDNADRRRQAVEQIVADSPRWVADAINESSVPLQDLADLNRRGTRVVYGVPLGKMGSGGFYDPHSDSVHINPVVADRSDDRRTHIVLHELGHAVQMQGGFSRADGYTSNMAPNPYREGVADAYAVRYRPGSARTFGSTYHSLFDSASTPAYGPEWKDQNAERLMHRVFPWHGRPEARATYVGTSAHVLATGEMPRKGDERLTDDIVDRLYSESKHARSAIEADANQVEFNGTPSSTAHYVRDRKRSAPSGQQTLF